MAKPPHTRAEMRVLYSVFRWWELAAGWRDTTEDSHLVHARVDDLPPDRVLTVLNITTTIGNEVVNCTRSGGDEATCEGVLRGKALIGGPVLFAADGTPVAKGTIALGP